MPPRAVVAPPSKALLLLVLALFLTLLFSIISVISIVTSNIYRSRTNATATAVAQAAQTATVVAQNPDPYPPYNGKLVLNDPLSQPDNWVNNSNNSFGGVAQFTQGAYHISQSKPHGIYTSSDSSDDFSNFAFEVQMTITKGACGGILFRNDDTKGSSYFFQVCQDGSYSLYLYLDHSGDNAKTLSKGSSQAIHIGYNQSNVIAVVANRNSLNLYVNNQKIGSASDATYSHGTIALCAHNVKATTEVIYSNAKVWALP